MMARQLHEIANISMLHFDALNQLKIFAKKSKGGILEIGPYIGGSTLAIALGNNRRRPQASIEQGGKHELHPTLPSSDILADLKANLARYGYENDVLICEGISGFLSVRQKAISHTGDIGLLFIDSDGDLASPFRTLANHMRDDCLLAIDDYHAPGAMEK